MKKSPYKPETASLAFNGVQDALDHSTEAVEDVEYGVSVHDSYLLKCYKKGELDLVFNLRIESSGEKYDLLFSAIPDGMFGDGDFPVPSSFDFRVRTDERCPNGGQDRVIVVIPYGVQSAEKIIPSVVWLERAKERPNLLRNVLALPVERIFESRRSIGEGKVSMLDLARFPRCKSDAVNGMVQSGTEISHDIPNDLRDGSVLKVARQSDLVEQLLRIIRVRFDNSVIGMLLNEGLNLPLEIVQMFCSPSDLALRTVEWSRHCPDCSNLKLLFEWAARRLRKPPTGQPGSSTSHNLVAIPAAIAGDMRSVL